MDIRDFLPWVRMIALSIHRHLPASVLLEDLIQDGMLGLVHAFREYRSDCGVSFSTYAGNKVRWAILDGLRHADWAERSVRLGANRINRTLQALRATLGREPNKAEIAEALGVRIDDVLVMLREASGQQFVYIDDESGDETTDIPDERFEPAAIEERRHDYATAIAHLKLLGSTERRAFILRVLCDKSGKEAAAELGLSESRVSQLVKQATRKMAVCLA